MKTDGGDCYEAAASALLFHLAGEMVPDGAVLVHGRPTLTRPPFEEYGHAWLELADTVFEVANGRSMAVSCDRYYEAGNIDPSKCFRYTVEQARRWCLDTRHFGPWEGLDACPPLENLEQEQRA